MPENNKDNSIKANKELSTSNTSAEEKKVDYEVFNDSSGTQYTKHSILQGIALFTTIGGCGGAWYDCVCNMGKWYEANIHTYQGTLAKPRKGKTWYMCPLINDTVADDCSGFVQACLRYYGVKVGSIATATMNEQWFMDLMQKSGFTHFSGNFTPENSQPGDILCGGPQTHTEIYAGNRQSWGWGNIHDGVTVKPDGKKCPGMPCGWCNLNSEGGYIHCWRATGAGPTQENTEENKKA